MIAFLKQNKVTLRAALKMKLMYSCPHILRRKTLTTPETSRTSTLCLGVFCALIFTDTYIDFIKWTALTFDLFKIWHLTLYIKFHFYDRIPQLHPHFVHCRNPKIIFQCVWGESAKSDGKHVNWSEEETVLSSPLQSTKKSIQEKLYNRRMHSAWSQYVNRWRTAFIQLIFRESC